MKSRIILVAVTLVSVSLIIFGCSFKANSNEAVPQPTLDRIKQTTEYETTTEYEETSPEETKANYLSDSIADILNSVTTPHVEFEITTEETTTMAEATTEEETTTAVETTTENETTLIVETTTEPETTTTVVPQTTPAPTPAPAQQATSGLLAFYSASDVDLLYRVVECEIGTGDLNAKMNVVSLIFNRMKAYNTTDLRGVLLAPGQFSVVKMPALYTCVVSQETIIACEYIFNNGNYLDTTNGALFFNSRLLTNSWAARNRPFAFCDGWHNFYY